MIGNFELQFASFKTFLMGSSPSTGLGAIRSRFRFVTEMKSFLAFHLLIASVGLFGIGAKAEAPQKRFEFSEPQMGVPFQIILYASSEAVANRASTAAFARIAEINNTLSNYETDSELSLLGYQSGKGYWIPISDDLYRIVAHAQRLAAETDGAFDLTVGPLAASWRNARRTQQYPHRDQLAQFLHRVGWRLLRIDHSRQQVWLKTPGMRLDPGGIAKGDALDQALRVLQVCGIRSALVAGAGDIAVSAPPPGAAGWRIRLTQAEESKSAPPTYVVLSNQAIATSGDLYQFVVIDGKRYSHIVDPRTGIGLTERRLVSVIAPLGITADSLATALSVIDLDRVKAVLEGYPETHALIVTLVNDNPLKQSFGQFEAFVSGQL
ncbi:MAG: FAD:protein FMN transferase [Verrucomicrobia subdivision 3 bacterium]|nr:FAD:protein FMN transferase [Limisphaerales bacterium]MCS1413949.1 FAD:protein FMN transferase [Limisphaerales bacterium]